MGGQVSRGGDDGWQRPPVGPSATSGDEELIYADSANSGLAKRPQMAGKAAEYRIAIRSGNRRILPDASDGRLRDPGETAMAHIRAKSEHPFPVVKQQYGVQKTQPRGMLKNNCKVNVLAALTNLFLARRHYLPHRTQESGVSRCANSHAESRDRGGVTTDECMESTH